MPPALLIRLALALVWFYEGLWCKLLGRMPHQEGIVEQVPFLGPCVCRLFLAGLGLAYARCLIHDPAGMVVKNFSFVVLIWAGAQIHH